MANSLENIRQDCFVFEWLNEESIYIAGSKCEMDERRLKIY